MNYSWSQAWQCCLRWTETKKNLANTMKDKKSNNQCYWAIKRNILDLNLAIFHFYIELRRKKTEKNSDWWSNENKSFLFNLKSEGGNEDSSEENLWFSFEVLRRRRRLIMVTITMNSSCMTPFPRERKKNEKSLNVEKTPRARDTMCLWKFFHDFMM